MSLVNYRFYWLNQKFYYSSIYDLSFFIYKFIKSLTFKGKSNLGYKCVYFIFWELKKLNINPLDFFSTIILRILPKMDLKKTKYRRRIITYPTFILYSRSVYLALKWIHESCRLKGEKKIIKALFSELFEIYNNSGNSLLKKKEFYQLILSSVPFTRTASRLLINAKKYVK